MSAIQPTSPERPRREGDDALAPQGWNWLQTIVDHSPAVVYIKDLDNRHVLVNRHLEELLGVPRERIAGQSNHDLFPADVADALLAHDRKVIETGMTHQYEEIVPRPNGPRTFVSLKFPLCDDEGRVCGVGGVSVDVTEQRLTAERLRREKELTQQLIHSSSDGILAFDTECRYTVWNPAMERIFGFPADQVLGRRAFDIFPFLTELGEDWYLYEALAGRSAVSKARTYTIPESGRSGCFEGYYAPIHDAEGRVVGGLAVIRDITERRRADEESLALARAEAAEAAARRFAFLAEAGEVLSASLDYDQTLQDVARLAIPVLGDLCIVDVVEDNRLRRVAISHVSSAKAAFLDELRRRYPPALDSPQPAGRVLRTGQPELLEEVTPDVVASHVRDAEHGELIRNIGIRSHLAVPLVARGVTVGVISLGVTESGRRYGPDDIIFAQELARRAAIAVDNARLYRAAQDQVAERGRAEEALRISEARFRAVMEQSPLPKQIYTADGRLLRVNKAWEALWGVSLEDCTEYNLLADPQFEILGVAPLIRRAFAGEPMEIGPVRYGFSLVTTGTRTPDRIKWIRAFAYPIKDTAGTVRELVLVQEDVTARVEAEESLRASEERLRLALAVARMSVWQWDLATDEVECSGDTCEFWSKPVSRAADFAALIHPDDLHALYETARAAIMGERPYQAEYRLQAPEGRIRWVQSRGHVKRGPDGRATHILGVSRDVTDLKFAEEANQLLADAGETLGSSLDYHATLQNLARLVVPRMADWCAVDLLQDGKLVRVSVNHPDPRCVALANELFAQYPPRPSSPYGAWHVLATGEAEWSAEINDGMLQAVAQTPEHLRILRELDLRSYICVPLVARGAAIGVLTFVFAESGRRYCDGDVELAKDLARRVAAAVDNAQLYQRLRSEDRRKDEFLATLAHELRNPLAPIRTGLEILRHSPSAAAFEKTRDIMERQLSHMVRLIDDLLDLSRVTRGKVLLHKERADLRSIVDTALEASRPLLDAAGLALTVRLPEEPMVFEADRTRLAQVVSNLLNNAAKYTDRGGHVLLGAVRDAGDVVIRVKDTGVGIPREMLTQVFEMFAQVGGSLDRSQGGLGIGLTLVKHLVELHGGQVWADSDGPGTGSTFFVRLPGSLGDQPAAHSERSDDFDNTGPMRRVLVVDDNADAAESLAMLLEIAGHEVRTAHSGPAALDIVAEFRPHVAFLDIGLPGMSGYELAQRLREMPHLTGLSLVAVTGWGQEEDRRQSIAAGFIHHLTKPVDPRQVQSLVG